LTTVLVKLTPSLTFGDVALKLPLASMAFNPDEAFVILGKENGNIMLKRIEIFRRATCRCS